MNMFANMNAITINLFIIFLLHLSFHTVISDDTVPIPPKKANLNAWFNDNVKPPADRKDLDPALAAAEKNVSHIKLSPDGKGDFKTIQEAINSIPDGNKQRVIISLAGGTYKERVKIDRPKPFITLYGDPKDRPTIVWDDTAAKSGTVYSATVYVLSDYFMAANIDIVNSAPRPNAKQLMGAQAVALTQTGDKAAFYNVKLKGFQDTFCDDAGRHFFKDSYIEGTVDFIFGNGKTLYLNTELHIIEGDNMAIITAQARHTEAENTAYCFTHCTVTGIGKGGLLGRGWMAYSRVIYAYTEISDAIIAQGWHGMKGSPTEGGTIFFGEYKNTGPGAALSSRAKFVKQLTEAEVKPFLNLGFIEGSKWLLPPPKV